MTKETDEGSIDVFEFFLVYLSKPTCQNWSLKITKGYFQIPVEYVDAGVYIVDGVNIGEGDVVQSQMGIYKGDQATICCGRMVDADIDEVGD